MSMKKHRARQFPEGKIHEHDEGALAMRVAADPRRNVVVIEFQGPVTWFAMPKKHAQELAALIAKHAASLPDTPAVNSPPAEDVQ